MPKEIVMRNSAHTIFDYCRSFLLSFSSKKNRLLIIAVILVPGIILWALSNMEVESPFSKPRIHFDESRDFTQIPFDEIDAFVACKAKTLTKFQNRLVRLTIDGHSTHFDDGAGLFKMFLFADVGDLRDYEEMRVYCFIDPSEYVISHYRTYSTQQKSLIDKTLGIFGF